MKQSGLTFHNDFTHSLYTLIFIIYYVIALMSLTSGGGFTSKRGVFGKHGKPITMLCGEYGSTEEQCFTGGADGRVYEWNKTSCVNVVDAHTGPVFIIEPAEKVNG